MARPKTADGYQIVSVRFPKDVLEAVRAYAIEHDRSVNEQIMNVLKRWLAEQKKDKTDD